MMGCMISRGCRGDKWPSLRAGEAGGGGGRMRRWNGSNGGITGESIKPGADGAVADKFFCVLVAR